MKCLLNQRVVVSIGLFLAAVFQRFVVDAGENNFVFNSKEINSIQYDVKISGDPVLNSEIANEHEMTMVNKFGQRYRCSIPEIEEMEQAQESEGGVDSSASKSDKSTAVLSTENIKNLLAPMANEPCLITTKDWWSYELCHNKAIRQFHMEDGKPSGAILVLGHYDHDKDWSRHTPRTTANEKVGHHSQFFTNGSVCDLNGEYRKTEVRFECDPLDVPDRIIRVDEPQSCEYIITVATSKICSVPQLKPEEVPKPKEISCSPVFNQQEYDQWVSIKEKRASILEKKQKEIRKKQKEEMLKVMDGEDISGIDVDTEEGMSELEGMVGNKLADKLMNSLSDLVSSNSESAGSPDSKTKSTTKKTTKSESPKYKEIELPSGEKKTVLVQEEDDNEDDNEDDDDDDEKEELDEETLKLKRDVKLIKQHAADLIKKKTAGPETLDDIKQRLNSNVMPKLEEMVAAANTEVGLNLNDEELEDMADNLKNIMAELELAEAEMDRLNKQIEAASAVQEEAEAVLQRAIEAKSKAETPISKPDLKEQPEQAGGDQDDLTAPPKSEKEDDSSKTDIKTKKDEKDDVMDSIIKITNVGMEASKVKGLAQSESEKRVVKHLEKSIKQKIAKSGLEVNGRTIEVKVITAGGAIPTDDSFGESSDDEDKQLQGMVYNLMVGDQQGYADIDHQRKSEMNYKFSLDELSKDTLEKEQLLLPSKDVSEDSSEEDSSVMQRDKQPLTSEYPDGLEQPQPSVEEEAKSHSSPENLDDVTQKNTNDVTDATLQNNDNQQRHSTSREDL